MRTSNISSDIIRRRLALGVASLGVFAFAAGCGGDDIADKVSEKVAEASSDENVDVDIDSDSGEYSVETEDGSVSVGNASLPDDWPEDVPMPDDYTLVMAASTADGFSATGNAPGSESDLWDEMSGALTDAGFEMGEEATFSAGDTKTYSAEFTNSDWTINLSVIGGAMTGSDDAAGFTYVVSPASPS